MQSKIFVLVLLVIAFGWAWRTYEPDLEDASVLGLFGIGMAMLFGAFIMGADIFFLSGNPRYFPFVVPGYGFIIFGLAVGVKRLWLRINGRV